MCNTREDENDSWIRPVEARCTYGANSTFVVVLAYPDGLHEFSELLNTA
jgi:hypothetical protein